MMMGKSIPLMPEEISIRIFLFYPPDPITPPDPKGLKMVVQAEQGGNA